MVYWAATTFPGRLGIMPRPRGGDRLDDEMRRLSSEGVDVLACLLDAAERTELELEREGEAAAACGMRFVAHAIPDHGVPASVARFREIVDDLSATLLRGESIAIHCYAGIGRSSLMAASVMTTHGVEVAEAFRLLSACRGLDVPDTAEQAAWVERFARSPRG